jgi:hypothetical protein
MSGVAADGSHRERNVTAVIMGGVLCARWSFMNNRADDISDRHWQRRDNPLAGFAWILSVTLGAKTVNATKDLSDV